MATILVTGGAGYIGSHTAKELAKKGYDVIVYDNLSSGKKRSVLKPTRLIVGDLSNTKKLDDVFKKNKIDAVMHFAAFIEAGESVKRPEVFFRNNVVNTLNLLETMANNKIKYIIFSSSAAVYGEPKQVPIKENADLKPINPYGATKLMVEEMLKHFDIAYGIKSISLRYFNAAGADLNGQLGETHSPETHLIPKVLNTALGLQDKIVVFGNDYNTKDGTCIRDYIHVTDLATAHILALKYLKKMKNSDFFNLGNEKGSSILEVIKTAKKITGIDFKVIQAKRRPGDPAKLVASSKKAREVLGWNPSYSDLETIVKTAWNWHNKNSK